MTIALNSVLGFMFGLLVKEKHESFVQSLSFTLPERHKVFWHWLVQPARESQLLLKPVALFLRSPWLLVPPLVIGLALLLVGVVSLCIDTANYIFNLSIGSFYGNAMLDFALALGSLLSLIGIGLVFNGLSFWNTKAKITSYDLSAYWYGIPSFVFSRMEEIGNKAKAEESSVEFYMKSTYKDPIMFAKVTRKDGTVESFAFAVFLPHNSEPFCE